MLQKAEIPIANGFYSSPVKQFSSQRCINLIPFVAENAAFSREGLFSTQGIKTFTTLPESFCRGAINFLGTLFVVMGGSLYHVTSDGNYEEIGDVDGQSRVSIAANDRYFVIVVPGSSAYYFDSSDNSFHLISNTNFKPASSVVFKDGYFIFSASDGSVFFNSALNDPSSYDALDFSSAGTLPDPIVGLHVNHNDLFVLGSETIEGFQNVGGSGFPFQKIPGANMQTGIIAPNSVAQYENTFVFIGAPRGGGPSIFRVSNASQAVEISTTAIRESLENFNEDELKNAFAISFSEKGNRMVAFTIMSDRISGKTFVYDATASALKGMPCWHERQSGTADDNWRVSTITKVYGDFYATDLNSGKIGIIDAQTYDEFDGPIQRTFITQPVNNLNSTIFIKEIELNMEVGVGNTVDPASDPKISMFYSDDGGMTYGNEHIRSVGKIGQYAKRVKWHRLGHTPVARVYKFQASDAVPFNFFRLVQEYALGSD